MNEDNLTQLEPIILYKGATSEIEFDFTDFTFENDTKCLLTIKTTGGKKIYTEEFNESKVYVVTFPDEFTIQLSDFCRYEYDIMYLMNEERYPQCLPSDVIVKKVVGSYEPNQS